MARDPAEGLREGPDRLSIGPSSVLALGNEMLLIWVARNPEECTT